MAGCLNPRAHPDCINAGNAVHECSDYCLRKIAERRALREEQQALAARGGDVGCDDARDGTLQGLPAAFGRTRPLKRRREGEEEHTGNKDKQQQQKHHHHNQQQVIGTAKIRPAWLDGSGAATSEEMGLREEGDGSVGQDGDPLAGMDERGRKLFELRMKLNQARKANQTAIVAEKKREDAPPETRGMSKSRWREEREKKMGKQLEACGLDMRKAYMLDTQEEAEKKYKKWEKKAAPFGGDVFNQKTLYKAYLKRAKDIPHAVEDYEKEKAKALGAAEISGQVVMGVDDSLIQGMGSALSTGLGSGLGVGGTEVPQENIDRMVGELDERDSKRKNFSRRRKFYEEKDIDYINERNAHFNRKIERAFGKYTVEIKNNLERGTALPD